MTWLLAVQLQFIFNKNFVKDNTQLFLFLYLGIYIQGTYFIKLSCWHSGSYRETCNGLYFKTKNVCLSYASGHVSCNIYYDLSNNLSFDCKYIILFSKENPKRVLWEGEVSPKCLGLQYKRVVFNRKICYSLRKKLSFSCKYCYVLQQSESEKGPQGMGCFSEVFGVSIQKDHF